MTTEINLDPLSGHDGLVALLARDVGKALGRIPAEGRRLLWVGYAGGGDTWLGAGWPRLAAAFEVDLPSLSRTAHADGWRSGWDFNRWPIAEDDIELDADTQRALDTTTVPVGDVDQVLGEVAATLARDDTSGDCIYIAIDDELEQLNHALTHLAESDVRRLRHLGLVPQGMARLGTSR